MAKNAKFAREYRVVVSGISTNEFSAAVLERALKGAIFFLDNQYKQVNVTMERTK